jgi:hypothetical protein
MEGGEVNLLGVDELIVCRLAQVFDVFDQEDVRL